MKTLIKDALRNIWKQRVSFISIIVIALLAVNAFLGISFAAKAETSGATAYYDAQNFQDIEVTSTCMLTDNDIEELKNLKNVTDVEGIRSIGAMLLGDNGKISVYARSITQRIGVPEVVEGRLPVSPNECAIEKKIMIDVGVKIGDEITLSDTGGGDAEGITGSTYTVTGIIYHPDHLSYEIDLTPYVLLTDDSFDEEIFDGCFVTAAIRTNAAGDRFEKKYLSAVDTIKKDIDKLSISRTAVRTEECKDTLTQRTDEAASELEAAQNELETSRNELEAFESELEASKSELDAAKEQLDTLKAQIDLCSSSPLLSAGLEELEFSYNEGLDRYNKGLDEYNEGLDRYNEGVDEYNEGLDSYNEGMEALETLRKEYEDFEECRWIVSKNQSNGGYTLVQNNTDSFRSVSVTFSLLFVVIAAMVVYASIAKMVEEQIKLVGVSKALGLKNGEVLLKYYMFGISATLIGVILGILSACFLTQKIILSGIGSYYVSGQPAIVIEFLPVFLCVVISIFLSASAVAIGCKKLFKNSAVTLMNGIPPEVKRNAAKKSKTGAGLFTRLIFFNMRVDLKRVIVTMTGVAGCCALMMIGCSMKFSIDSTIKKQFSRVQTYNATITYDDKVGNSRKEMTELVEGFGGSHSDMRYEILTFSIGDNMSYAHTYCVEPEDLDTYWNLVSPSDNSRVTLSDYGLVVSESLLNYFNVSIGDFFTIYDASMHPYTVRIAGVFVNYLNETFFCTPAWYEEVFGKAPTDNAMFVKDVSIDNEELFKSASAVPGFVSFSHADRSESFETISGLMNILIIAMMIMSGLLSFFVLTNVANTYIIERRLELTVMRINGFSWKQCIIYAAAEVLITVFIGMIAGVFLGTFMGKQIIRMVEQVGMMLFKRLDVRSVLISSAVALIFASLIYGRALMKIKDFSLSDITRG